MGSIFCPFGSDSVLEERKTILTELPALKMYPMFGYTGTVSGRGRSVGGAGGGCGGGGGVQSNTF